MLRLVLLVLYLIASSASSHTKQDSGLDHPQGLNTPPPQTHGGGGVDPLGLNTSSPPPQTDGGGGWDPLG